MGTHTYKPTHTHTHTHTHTNTHTNTNTNTKHTHLAIRGVRGSSYKRAAGDRRSEHHLDVRQRQLEVVGVGHAERLR